VKISSFLFLQTDANEQLLMTDIPNSIAPWRAMTALIETDWYPASLPWHARHRTRSQRTTHYHQEGRATLPAHSGPRDAYFARQMSPQSFDDFFDRGQRWLATHGKFEHESATDDLMTTRTRVADITATYVKQQVRSKFVVML
jgi:hypothetical protein